MLEAVAVMNDHGLAELCRLLEREDMLISPDAVWLSSRPGFYGHLLALDAIAVSRERALDILCPECGIESMRPQPYAAPESQPYRGYCPECGWIVAASVGVRHVENRVGEDRASRGARDAPKNRTKEARRIVARRHGLRSRALWCAASARALSLGFSVGVMPGGADARRRLRVDAAASSRLKAG